MTSDRRRPPREERDAGKLADLLLARKMAEAEALARQIKARHAELQQRALVAQKP